MVENKGWSNITPLNSETAKEVGRKGGLAKKGSKHINTWIQNLLTDENFTTKILDGYEFKEYKGAPLVAILEAQVRLALNSKDETTRIKATELLFKHGWTQKIDTDITSGGEKIGVPVSADQLSQLARARTERTDT